MVSCRTTRYVPEGKYMLRKNIVNIKDNALFSMEANDIDAIIKQKPNKRILGLYPFYLDAYNIGVNFPIKKMRNTLTQTIGEEPVIFDSILVKKSIHQINIFLKNKGYLDNEVQDSVILKNKRAYVYYIIYLHDPYLLQNISVEIEDNDIVQDIIASNKKSLIHTGQFFNVDIFDQDRAKLVNEMQNRGYYAFSKEYIKFEVDTMGLNKKVNVIERITDPIEVLEDTFNILKHKKYYINNIQMRESTNDSILYPEKPGIYFSKGMSRKLNTTFLTNNIFITPNDLFKIKDFDFTYNRLMSFKIFKGVTIRTDEIILPQSDTAKGYLNVSITAPFQTKNSVSFETNGTNRSGNLGVSANLNFKKRNPFKNAEILELNTKVGLEAQKSTSGLVSNTDQTGINSIFNTFQYGVQGKINIPKILFPYFKKNLANLYAPKTEMSGLYDYQRIPFFERNVVGAAWQYTWGSNLKNSFAYSPLDVNVVKVKQGDAFKELLASKNNPYLNNAYQDHFILASKFHFTYNSREPSTKRNYISYRASLESAGNLLQLLISDTNIGDVQPVKIFGIQYSQYVRFDADIRMFYVLGKSKSIIYRAFAGVGAPLRNSPSLPFEKSFFGGGANGIRAWQIRTLGPGAMNKNISSFYKIGDIQLEGNAEYRFDIIDMLKGAFFVDAGNIWLFKPDTIDRPGAEFKWNKFYKQIAIGAGAGARLDFSFFIIRLDWALQIHDPSQAAGEKWIFQKKDIYFDTYHTKYRIGSNLNLAIGYPF